MANANMCSSNSDGVSWGKSLTNMPAVTIKEIEIHRQHSGKGKAGPVLKTLERGRKFKEERYITADSIFTSTQDEVFHVKATSKASMKNEFRQIRLSLSRANGQVDDATCSCPAGLSEYCKHVMALLFELADYRLNQLKGFPRKSPAQVNYVNGASLGKRTVQKNQL